MEISITTHYVSETSNIIDSDPNYLPRPNKMTYVPMIMELMDAGKNCEIPPRTMMMPIAMLTSRLLHRV